MNKANQQVEKKSQWKRIGEHRSMAMTILLTILALPIIVCLSCSKSGAPSCNDEPVKKLVLDISREEFRHALFDNAIKYNTELPRHNLGTQVHDLTYDEVNKLKDAPDINTPYKEEARKLMSTVDQQVTALNINLTNIRLNGKHDDIKKCECGGDLTLSNGKALPITYTAQYTEDGKIYVEVSGLK